MPTKISNLTSYDGDVLDGSEIMPLTETDEGKTEGITVSQLFSNAPSATINGTFTHSPSTDATDAAVFQDQDGNDIVRVDSTNDRFEFVDPASGRAIRLYHDGAQPTIQSSRRLRFKTKNSSDVQLELKHNSSFTAFQGLDLGRNIALWGSLYTESPIKDSGDNELLDFASNSSAVNHLQVANAASGNAPTLSAVGGDTNIDLALSPKGTGLPDFQNASTATSASAGANGDVPSQVDGYLSIKIDGTEHKVPFYQT